MIIIIIALFIFLVWLCNRLIANAQIHTYTDDAPPKRRGCGTVVIVIIAVLVISGLFNSNNNPQTSDNKSSNRTTTKQQQTETEKLSTNLTRLEYIADCVTVDYTSVARNPSAYEGERIKVEGKVIQVSEGWFDSVTLRVKNDEDTWYITYTRDENESRILENDEIICYGECTGVESYTTVLGSTVTIPSMKMMYFENRSQSTSADPTEPVNKINQYAITYNKITVWEGSYNTLYQGIVEIVNTGNTTLYLSSGKFDIETEDGTLIASKDSISVYPQIIKPGEKAYYYGCSALEGVDPTATYKIIPKVNGQESTNEQIYLSVSDFRLEDGKYGLKAIGRIENTTSEEQSRCRVVVICYNSNGEPVAVLSTSSDKMAPGEKFGEELSESTLPPEITAASVADFSVYVYPYQYQW